MQTEQQQTERQALYFKEIAPLAMQLREACEKHGFHFVAGIEIETVHNGSLSTAEVSGACNMSADAADILQAVYFLLTKEPLKAMPFVLQSIASPAVEAGQPVH